jgi:Alw26I/Eco31I/Esp3I family type II restriction endonuclease
LRVEYAYPNANLIKKLSQTFGLNIIPFEKDIFEILSEIPDNQENTEKLIAIFKTSDKVKNVEKLKNWLYENHTKVGSKSFLSPGVMSNPPDRYDGFHSDGNCCRSKSDKGRHTENMQRYGQDRRVYENWADGDWKQADRLMSMFRKFGLSADHIGPISLGFCHRPKFHPLTKEENSAKNNRMSFDDVQILIGDEINGEQVVSWHSKYIWDLLKNEVQNDKNAVKLSSLMRTNLHWILTIFAMIDEQGHREFLMQFLNLQYSDFDYQFPDFQPDNIGRIIQIEKKGKNQANNKERYIRVAFESLEEYKNKDNRRVELWKNKEIDIYFDQMNTALNDGKYDVAKNVLHIILQKLAHTLRQKV